MIWRPHCRPIVCYGELTVYSLNARVDTGGWVFRSIWPQVMWDVNPPMLS